MTPQTEKKNLQNLVRLLEEYIAFLAEANEGPLQMAWVHGWRCSDADFERGKEFRQEIVEAATLCGMILNGW